MNSCVCVDYLSHEWACTDLIQAHRELKRVRSKHNFDATTKQHTAKELKKLSLERVRQSRYQNAIWRQMARSCTNNLSSSNQMIPPSSVNWQKESDVTWLYGPLYMPPESSTDMNTHPSLSFSIPVPELSTALKPVLKKNIPSPSKMLQRDYWVTNDRFWSKCASDSGKQSVRFNPHITEVKFQSESPVKESFRHRSKKPVDIHFQLDSEGEEEEEEEDIWKVILQVGSYFKSVLFSTLFPISPQPIVKHQQQVVKSNQINLIQWCFSSAVSFTAWIMYRTITRIMNHTPLLKSHTNNRLLERKNTH